MSKGAVVPFPKGSKRRELEYVIEQYHVAHPERDPSEAIPDLIAEWAYRTGLWRRPPADPVDLLRKDISRYLRSEYITDPQGREVRKNHAIIVDVQTPAGSKRRSIWMELFHASPEHMKASSQLRRRGLLRDAVQLDLDLKSYNDNNVFGVALPSMDFDLNKDIEEINLPTTYPSEPFDDEEDDDV